MGNCIYCVEREADSKEDWFPRCFGTFRNNERLAGKLCNVCNSTHLGRLHEYFCRCTLEGLIRRELGIKGQKHHRKVNPFYRRSAGGKHIVVLSKHPVLNCKMYWELVQGTTLRIPARQIIVVDDADRCHAILILDRMKTLDQFRIEVAAKGLQGSRFLECYTASPDEKDWLERLCSVFEASVKWSDKIPYEPPAHQACTIMIGKDEKYFREIAQIAFHYYLRQFPHITGFEKELADIKNFILNGGNAGRWVKRVEGDFVKGYTGHPEMHTLAVERNMDNITARVHFFMSRIAWHWEVYIGKNPDRILLVPPIVAHQFEYFEKPDGQNHDGIMKPLKVIRKNLLLLGVPL